MSQVTVRKAVNGYGPAVNPFFLKLEDTLAAVRKRAFELFEQRGGAPGGDVADWVQAEQDLFFIPSAELVETDKGLTMTLYLDGFSGRDIEVMTRPGEILVWAANETHMPAEKDGAGEETVSKSLYSHISLSDGMDAAKVKTHLDGSVLTVEVPRAASQPVLVRAVAA